MIEDKDIEIKEERVDRIKRGIGYVAFFILFFGVGKYLEYATGDVGLATQKHMVVMYFAASVMVQASILMYRCKRDEVADDLDG